MSAMTIKVTTEALRSASTDADEKIRAVQRAFDEIGQVVSSSRTYWEGEGQNAYLSTYRRKKEHIDTALARFHENVTDLQQMAGIYEEAENQSKEQTQSLSADVIV